jgi:hypothetical protein
MIDQIPENEMLRNRFMPEQISNAGDGSPDSAQDIEQRLAELRR